MGDGSFSIKPIGYVSSCYKEKFGIPRQPGLVTEAQAVLHLLPAFSQQDNVRGLEGFSHVWLIFMFHATAAAKWKPTVRPPRLGGNARLGVFATRSMFRPNPLGLSVVSLNRIQHTAEGIALYLSGIDLLDGTPVLDIKPYLPYADSVVDAVGGFATHMPDTACEIVFSAQAREQCAVKSLQWQVNIDNLLRQILAQDPRPSYRGGSEDGRVYGMRLHDFDVQWCYRSGQIEVLRLDDIPQ